MILAAGRGERMRPLTDATPKPLLKAGGKALIEYPLEKLSSAGYTDIVINIHHLGEQIREFLGSGQRYGVTLHYCDEQPEALETGGGIFNALPWLGKDAFCVVNADIHCDHDLAPPALTRETLAHLVLVPNPAHNPEGDFALRDGKIATDGGPQWTFSGIGWYRPELFNGCQPGKFPLAPLLRRAAEKGQGSGEIHHGLWFDIGAPERLRQLNEKLRH